MISVRRFSLQGSVWRQITPMMEQAVRWINEHEEPLGRPVPLSIQGSRSALVAEVAFRRVAVGAPIAHQDEDAERAAAALIALLPRGQFGDEVLSDAERLEASLIQNNLIQYTGVLIDPEYLFAVPGCGVVNHAIGDIYCRNILTEVKTVARPFRSQDLRQLLTYAAMMRASGKNVESLSLYNPRRARVFSDSIDDVAHNVCGKPAVELLEELVDAMVGFQVSA
jgi:hypothetical protein